MELAAYMEPAAYMEHSRLHGTGRLAGWLRSRAADLRGWSHVQRCRIQSKGLRLNVWPLRSAARDRSQPAKRQRTRFHVSGW